MFGTVIGWVGEPLFWSSVGLIVGWNFLPQPAFVKKTVDWVSAKVKAKLAD